MNGFDRQYAGHGIAIMEVAAIGVFERHDVAERIDQRIVSPAFALFIGYGDPVVHIADMIPLERGQEPSRTVDHRPLAPFAHHGTAVSGTASHGRDRAR